VDESADITEDDLFRSGDELFASRSYWPLLKTGLAAREYTLRDVLNVKTGADLVNREMAYDVLPKPSDGEIHKVDVPVFLLLGRHDFNTPSQLAAQCLERLDAPIKRLKWFEQSAHCPFFEEPEKFHRELLQAAQTAAEFWKNQPLGRHPDPQRRTAAVEPRAAAGGCSTHGCVRYRTDTQGALGPPSMATRSTGLLILEFQDRGSPLRR
jgi:hypothetical protein